MYVFTVIIRTKVVSKLRHSLLDTVQGMDTIRERRQRQVSVTLHHTDPSLEESGLRIYARTVLSYER